MMIHGHKECLAYLVVLGYEPILTRLSETDRRIGQANMMGCLHSICDYLESFPRNSAAAAALEAINVRERINGRTDQEAAGLLPGATAKAAEVLYDFYKRFVV